MQGHSRARARARAGPGPGPGALGLRPGAYLGAYPGGQGQGLSKMSFPGAYQGLSGGLRARGRGACLGGGLFRGACLGGGLATRAKPPPNRRDGFRVEGIPGPSSSYLAFRIAGIGPRLTTPTNRGHGRHSPSYSPPHRLGPLPPQSCYSVSFALMATASGPMATVPRP